MPQFCKICAYPDQAAVRAAFAPSGSDREILLPLFRSPALLSGATIGYDGGRPHLIRYCSGVV
jgi:hypothetical protein